MPNEALTRLNDEWQFNQFSSFGNQQKHMEHKLYTLFYKYLIYSKIWSQLRFPKFSSTFPRQQEALRLISMIWVAELENGDIYFIFFFKKLAINPHCPGM